MNQNRPRKFGEKLEQVRTLQSLQPFPHSILDFLEESATTPGSTATAAGIKTVLKTTNAALVPAILRNSLRVIFFMVIFSLCFINCCNYFGYVSCSFLFNSASESPLRKLLCIYLPHELLLSHSYCCRSAPSCKHSKRCP